MTKQILHVLFDVFILLLKQNGYTKWVPNSIYDHFIRLEVVFVGTFDSF